MQQLTISPQFNGEIPRDLLEALGVEPGQRLQAILYDNRLELVPVRSPSELRSLIRRSSGTAIAYECRGLFGLAGIFRQQF